MAEKFPLINGALKYFPKTEQPMVVTVWSDSQRGSLLLPEHFWKAALEWAYKNTNARMIKALHLDCERVGVDLYLDEGDDPDCVRHTVAAELTQFLADYMPEHKDCDSPNDICPACWREEVKERRSARAKAV